MAVDLKTLRIGSHVLMDGVRAKVVRLNTVKYCETEAFHILVRGVLLDGREGECGCFADDKAVQPIPITPELLTELGFKWRETAGAWRKYQNYDGKNYDWGIYICYSAERGCMISLCLKDYRLRPQLYAKYLHELEGQLAYYGIELIPN